MENFQNEQEFFKRPSPLLANPSEVSKKKKVVKIKKSSLLEPKLIYKNTQNKKSKTPKKKYCKQELDTESQQICIRNRERNISDVGPEIFNREKHRPKSVINKPLLSNLDILPQSKTFKRNHNPSMIDQIIKKSLKKAKKQKVSQEKQQKVSQIINEIKKNELDYKNKQIRMHNLSKNKKKKSKTQKPISPCPDFSNITTVMTEHCHKHKCQSNLSVDLTKPNKRSCSVEYKPKDSSILAYMDKKKKQRHRAKEEENIRKSAEYAVKAGKLKKLDNFYKGVREKSINKSFSLESVSSDREKDKENIEINRNISFICENSSDKESDKDEFCEINIFREFTESDNKVTETREDDINRYIQNKNWRAIIEQAHKTEILKDLEIVPQEYIEIIPQPKYKPELSEEKISDIGVKIIEKQKNAQTCQTISDIEVKPQPKPLLSVYAQQGLGTGIIKNPIKDKLLDIAGLSSFTIKPKVPIKKFNETELLKEQLSWSQAITFLIEQLQVYEITNLAEFTPERQELLTDAIQRKYSRLLKCLTEIFDSHSRMILETISLEEHSKFIQSTQRKKLDFHRMLIENYESIEVDGFNLKKKTLENSESSESEEDSHEDPRFGISHSKSLTKLHDEVASKRKNVDENTEKKDDAPLFFNFEGGLIIQNKEFDLQENEEVKEEPTGFHLSLQKIDAKSALVSPCMDFNNIKKFILSVFDNIDNDKLLRDLQKPLIKNPLSELDKLQELQIGTPTEVEIFQFPELINISSFIPNYESFNPPEKAEAIHKKMILQTLNYLLQQFRPFGYKGLPFPWIDYSKVFAKKLSLREIIYKVLQNFESLNEMEIGNPNEYGVSNSDSDEMIIIKIKEKQLERALFTEAYLEDYKWVDYEFEETQVKIDTADMILHDLAEEIININL
ncbi:hypothetical protein SteCoe_24005 [Stentor coeruleus]|uniref:DUF4378 domain-containing protein n=1 Tax=Stentor coeruleus TaxID=5963 RepID=A0A1R2BIJ4_9CILI|nr:hypothetical protein SteCoe_24005 [Stentor coeruleus]